MIKNERQRNNSDRYQEPSLSGIIRITNICSFCLGDRSAHAQANCVGGGTILAFGVGRSPL
jgi:hypothetical protein